MKYHRPSTPLRSNCTLAASLTNRNDNDLFEIICNTTCCVLVINGLRDLLFTLGVHDSVQTSEVTV